MRKQKFLLLHRLISAHILIFLLTAQASRVHARLIFADEVFENPSETFRVGEDDDTTATSLTLEFGGTNTESLQFDTSAFILSDDFNVQGNISQDGTLFTLDNDNVGAGASVDIVANQGADNDGTLRYNAITNQWEISNDGGAFEAIIGTSSNTLDEAYNNGQSITVDGSGDLIFNLTNIEDFVIQDAGSPAFTVDDSANVTVTDGSVSITDTADETAFSVISDSVATATGSIFSLDGLTTGTGMLVETTNNAVTSGTLFDINHDASAITANFSGSIFALSSDRTLNLAASQTDSGHIFDIDMFHTVNNAGASYTVDSDAINIAITGTSTLGTLNNDNENAIDITQIDAGDNAINSLLSYTAGTNADRKAGLESDYLLNGAPLHSGAFPDNFGAGISGQAIISSTGASTGDLVGVAGIGATATVGSIGTATELSGVAGHVDHAVGGTITEAAGFRSVAAVNDGGGTITRNYGLYIEDQTAGSDDYGLYIAGSDTNAIWVDNDDVRFDGNAIVGGNTNTTETIDDGGFSLGGDDLYVAGQLGVEEASYIDAPLEITNLSGGDSFIVNDEASDTTPFVIQADGDVGIGLAAPARPLHVEATGANFGADYATIEVSTTATSGFGASLTLDSSSITSGGGANEYIIAATGNSDVSGEGNLIFYDFTQAATRMLIESDGDVGLGGEIAPAHPLDITGTGQVIEMGSGTAADIIINFDDDDGDQNFGWDDSEESFSTFNEELIFRTQEAATEPVACIATTSGMQWVDTDSGILFICDTSNGRNKWLSVTEFTLTGGETASCAAAAAPTAEACTQDIHNGTDANDLGYQLPRNATIVGGSFHSDVSCTDGTGVDLEVANGDNGGVAFLGDILTGCTDANGCSATGLNIDVAVDDVIRARLDNNCVTGNVTDWSSIFMMRWRPN